ncbi:MAG TPA: hypothetical protein VFZ73_04055 [Gemmatimonadaceae bacterium]
MSGARMTISHHAGPIPSRESTEALSKRIDGVGWGVLLIMTGALWLVPEQDVPRGAWLMGTGILLLVLNAIRSAYGVGARPLSVFLGVVVLATGLSDYLGWNLPIVALGLIVIGASILARQLVSRPT